MSFADVVRKEFKASDEERDKDLVTPSDVVRYDDICYTEKNDTLYSEINDKQVVNSAESDVLTKNGSVMVENVKDCDSSISTWHLLDVYRPKDTGAAKLPVIVNVHGGGWVYGDKDVYQYYCMDLSRRGFAVVNYSYRLAPQYKFPAQLEDTVSAFRWVYENAEKFGFDSDRVYAVGDSAGANILALYCLACTNDEYGAKYDFVIPRSYRPKAVALNCGTYDITASRREMKGFMAELMPGKGTAEEIDLLNVTKYINKEFPPTFLMTCYGDFLKDQAPLLEERLKELDIIYMNRLYGSEEEPLKHVFHCDIRMSEAKVCNDETCEFFVKQK